VRNAGSGTWPGNSFIYGRGNRGDVVAGIRAWRPIAPPGDGVAQGLRGGTLTAVGMLPANLGPNESAVVFISGPAPAKPGVYLAEIDMGVVEGAWVSASQPAPVTVRVTVE